MNHTEAMAWRTFSLHFRQVYDGGWRYLDKCGEFMLAATREMDFMPREAKPTGAMMGIPEKGISVALDASEMVVTQEQPEDAVESFQQICMGLDSLANKFFSPTAIVTNGLASKSIWPMPSTDAALASTLKLGDTMHADLAKVVGMVPAHTKVDCNFSSGSMELHVVVQAVTFERVSVSHHTAGFQASASKKRRAERLNKAAEHYDPTLHDGLMLEVDLIEIGPPKTSLENHFRELRRHSEALRMRFTLP
jgi:hypothetical protein